MGNIFDLLKFVLSLMVVAIHINPLGSTLWKVRYPIVRIAVPLFFIMSSYFFFKKIKDLNKQEQFNALKKCIKRNLILYISWFIILYPVTYDIWGKRFLLIDLLYSLFLRFFFSSTFKSSWYLMALTIGIVLVYYLSKIIKNNGCFIVSAICYIFCTLLCSYGVYFEHISLVQTITQIYPYTIYYGFPVGLIFITMGKMLAEKEELKVNKMTYIYTTIFAVLLYIESYLVVENHWYKEPAYFIMLIPFCWYFFILVSNININFKYGKELRVISTIMYCFHYSFKYIIIDYIPWNISLFPYSLYFYLIIVLASILLSLIIYYLSHKIKILKMFY